MKVLSFDLGASSGRAVLGIHHEQGIKLIEIHRFVNRPIKDNQHVRWDIPMLFKEIKKGISKCVELGHRDITSISIDTWGVDFGLIDSNGVLMQNPIHYRDPSFSDQHMESIISKIGREKMYKATGIQFINFNSIYQLAYLKSFYPDLMRNVHHILWIPDLFNYLLTGVMVTEYTVATTSGMINLENHTWDVDILNALDLDCGVFPPLQDAGTQVGFLSEDIMKECKIGKIPVHLSASHDTASAVLAIPFSSNSAFISCGTWSLIGVELEKPITTKLSYQANYTNEGGYGGTIRFLKNINGLWLIQELIKSLEESQVVINYEMLEEEIARTKSMECYINPNDKLFMESGNMFHKIQQYFREHNMPILESRSEIGRCILESLAQTYLININQLGDISHKEIDTIHLVGGGAQSEVLCQLTANKTHRKVIAGPVEATALGNIITQLIALKSIKDLVEARDIIRKSYEFKEYLPQS
ncbi:MAG: hypothetical protein A2Y45_06315 [Tenericutes bacterium GWC2_34_14]|nr:MAG: hypothetical protein A2Z84_00705 [Tenericutes bacterium GWA2_35_7]OHE28568.1 MAG: hypothetical protein A2Y45_06315 [Tenericutes bacterium GWC2_34_14]OHE33524.1 MAG: hypothetical protein A2012_03495 [Tenericutes bacterium GWE2_34_108]OHE36809.1 MAG: hypothetical protein A2Y46_09295 [Tenericutes bacterium GWF1_35_14]OHE38111.1 MAG: hypothetical protein A2Y44_09370 [Tenericutes bacterium GWF2_35_184]OHE42133.1 MAG: hypothetical protein A3K26_07030 [Tenericutes bacterium RIFOXYA12_FULL_35_